MKPMFINNMNCNISTTAKQQPR